jgi:hypothetical protein
MTDQEFIEKLISYLEFKQEVHTNPVEVGIQDLERLIKLAKQSVYKQGEIL